MFAVVRMNSIICPYCNIKAKKVGGKVIYPRRPDLYHHKFYLCKKCGARVGINKVTGKPLGTLANYELRIDRMNAHKCFDKLWKSKKYSRSEAYEYLASAMGISTDKCHIGMFNSSQCEEVIKITRLLQQRK